MNCNRCGSLMVYEKFYSFHEPYWGWRCINCGEILDEIILENRRTYRKRREPKPYRKDMREIEKEGLF